MRTNPKNIVIIPARGGSKRLPFKNIRPLNGKPLIEYSIDYAKTHSDLVSKIVVSTDDEAIKEVALKNDVEVVNRPKDLSGDHATTVSALKHVIETSNQQYDNVILLQITNPLRPKTLLRDSLAVFLEGDYDSLMTVTRNEHKLGKINKNRFIPFNYEFGQRSQDLEPLYFENGLLYITKTKHIKNNLILGENNYPMIVNHPYASVDIDTEEDFKYAQFILENFTNE